MPSDVIFTVLTSVLGAASLTFIFLRIKNRAALIEQRAAFESERAILQERLSAQEREVQSLQHALGEEQRVVQNLRTELTSEARQRATAEERCAQIGRLDEQLAQRDQQLNSLQKEVTSLRAIEAELKMALEKERKVAEEKLAVLEDAQRKLSDAFKALSAEALKVNNSSFLELARATLERFQEGAKGDLERRQQAIDSLVKPVKESLEKFDTRIQDLEKARVGAYEALNTSVRAVLDGQEKLRMGTDNLVRALGTARVRGRWGEIQLRRVVELAGMLAHCDFHEQQSVTTEEGKLRPDLIVRLPGGRNIVVDAKAPLAGYLEALESTSDETRKLKLIDHARHVRDHLAALSKKGYWEQFSPAPEFVVLFLPGEPFYSAALEQDPTLIEVGVEQRVLIATPTTLIALLKAVAYGWRQERLSENAAEISVLGKELYKRVCDLGGHFSEVGSRLGKAIESYNKAVGSLETRVLVSARRFKELEAASTDAELEVLAPIDTVPRQLQSAELLNVASETPTLPSSKLE